jgi:phosphoglycolate phosphatase
MHSQLIIFDLDGTLIDSRADLAAGINHMRAYFGWEPLSVEKVGSYVGNGVRKLVERSLQGADVDFEEALQVNLDYYRAHMTDQTTFYDGVAQGIADLVRAGHKVAVMTNKGGDISRGILAEMGLASFFCTIVGGGDVANLKPAADGLLRCAEIAGVGVSDAWMVGDNYTDLESAQNAKMKSAFVEYGFGDPREYKADINFASFSELVGYFV